jgi:RNA polymerase-binding protein DksA
VAKKNPKAIKTSTKRPAKPSAKAKAASRAVKPARPAAKSPAKSAPKPPQKPRGPKPTAAKVPPAKSNSAKRSSAKPVVPKAAAKPPVVLKLAGVKSMKPRRLPKPPPPPVVITTVQAIAPPTSEKPARNTAGLNDRELDFYRDLLLAKRREIMGDMSSMEREALREQRSDLSNLPVHMADQGTDAYEQEFTLTLVEKDRQLLREINAALAKIQDGSYGICEGTGKPIGKPRLEAQPWARYSIDHARELERRRGHFRR